MIRRTYIGLDLSAGQLTAVALQRGRQSVRLTGVRREPVGGLLELSSRQPNISDPRRFTELLRRALDPLADSEERIAVSLPDRIGRLYLVEVETAFKNYQEGVDILKWRLKGSLPAVPHLVQLGYQILEGRDDGRLRCAVAAIALPVLEQYEEAILAAGRQPVQIDLHGLSLYNYYQPRLDLGDELLLVTVEPETLGIMYFNGRIPAYQRICDVAAQPGLLFHELGRTLVEATATHPAIQRCPVSVHLDPELDPVIRDTLTSALGRDVRILDPQLKRLSGGASIGLAPAGTVLAALGAAERLMIK